MQLLTYAKRIPTTSSEAAVSVSESLPRVEGTSAIRLQWTLSGKTCAKLIRIYTAGKLPQAKHRRQFWSNAIYTYGSVHPVLTLWNVSSAGKYFIAKKHTPTDNKTAIDHEMKHPHIRLCTLEEGESKSHFRLLWWIWTALVSWHSD